MTREPFHLDPEKERPGAAADFFERFSGRVVNLLDVFSLDLAPVVPFENVQRERVRFSRRHADAIGVVFDEKEHGKCFFFGETDCLKEISLACCGVTDCGNNDILFPVKFNAPGDTACRKKL